MCVPQEVEEAIARLVDYLWRDEQYDYERHIDEGGAPADHIFYAVKTVDDWLEAEMPLTREGENVLVPLATLDANGGDNPNDTDPGEHAIAQAESQWRENAERDLAEFEASPELQEAFKNDRYYRGPALLWTGGPAQPGELFDASQGDFTQGVLDAATGEPGPLPTGTETCAADYYTNAATPQKTTVGNTNRRGRSDLQDQRPGVD